MKYSSFFKLLRSDPVLDSQSQNIAHVPSHNHFEDFLSNLVRLRPDLSDAYIKSLLLDEKKYLSFYEDIRNSGLSGIHHYYTYGFKEGREFFEPNFRAIKKTKHFESGQSIIFFDSDKTNASNLYRGYFPEVRKKSSVIIDRDMSFLDSVKEIFIAKEVVFIRPSSGSRKTKYFIQLCRTLNVTITIDMDDLLLPDYSEYEGAVRSGISDYHQTLKERTQDSSILLGVDKMICSTKTIAGLHSDLIKDISISKNKLPREYFIPREKVANKIINSKVRVLYLSGSKTHLKDYSTISGPLIKLAQNYPNKFSLSLLGMVSDQTSIFSHMGVECNLMPLVNFDEMLAEINKHDIVLVPLEKTVFNDAKSNIKFIEAASQGVAVIASSVTEYDDCITNNENGWICSTEDEWFATLSYLFDNPEAITNASLKAYDSAIAGYSL